MGTGGNFYFLVLISSNLFYNDHILLNLKPNKIIDIFHFGKCDSIALGNVLGNTLQEASLFFGLKELRERTQPRSTVTAE